MRKTSREFNSDTVIENIGYLCGRPELPELPYWETINDYLKRLDPGQLQGVVCGLVRRLLWSRVFEDSRIRGRYWQVIVDGTQLESSRRELDPKSLYRIHRKGTPEEY
ncbi:MAG: transposase, partial [Eisenbergiella sp.]